MTSAPIAPADRIQRRLLTIIRDRPERTAGELLDRYCRTFYGNSAPRVSQTGAEGSPVWRERWAALEHALAALVASGAVVICGRTESHQPLYRSTT